MPEATSLNTEGTSSTDASQQTASTSTDATTSQQSGTEGASQQTTTATEGDTSTDTASQEGTQGDKANSDAEGDDNKPEGSPEKYDAFTMPEGIELKGEKLERFESIAKELNLTQAQAQKLASLGGDLIGDISKQQSDHMEQVSNDWKKASENDKEFGGVFLSENMATAKKALDAFASQTFRELLDKTGLGNHPEVVRTFFRVGKAISEDKVITSNQENTSRDPADILFG